MAVGKNRRIFRGFIPLNNSNKNKQRNWERRTLITNVIIDILISSLQNRTYLLSTDTYKMTDNVHKQANYRPNHIGIAITTNFQEHPTTVFRKISVRRRKYCLEFSITSGRLKTSRWPFHSRKIFEAYLINVFKFNFSQLTAQVWLFFVWKKKLKIFGFKN